MVLSRKKCLTEDADGYPGGKGARFKREKVVGGGKQKQKKRYAGAKQLSRSWPKGNETLKERPWGKKDVGTKKKRKMDKGFFGRAKLTLYGVRESVREKPFGKGSEQ